MATPVGLGIPVPKMLPITGTFALPLALYGAVLSSRVVGERKAAKKALGDTTDRPRAEGAADSLQVASRAHANFSEYVPLALVLAAFAELNGANKKGLSYALTALTVLRVVHVELGLRAGDHGAGPGRGIGYLGTQGIIVGLATYSAYLIKGYWGF